MPSLVTVGRVPLAPMVSVPSTVNVPVDVVVTTPAMLDELA